jgi:phage host-nuclease inhibitor protein Gam
MSDLEELLLDVYQNFVSADDAKGQIETEIAQQAAEIAALKAEAQRLSELCQPYLEAIEHAGAVGLGTGNIARDMGYEAEIARLKAEAKQNERAVLVSEDRGAKIARMDAEIAALREQLTRYEAFHVEAVTEYDAIIKGLKAQAERERASFLGIHNGLHDMIFDDPTQPILNARPLLYLDQKQEG